ncbi:MAG: SGNH/GDSL hydrolase family protein [Planctomycetaceae bacterium]|nr:SGNH/GDSL hydrolase family protein [Planctomycetaceae bacterium]
MKKILLALTVSGLVLSQVAAAQSPASLREDIEWCRIWIECAAKHDLPRVLLIGDSICVGYQETVSQELAGKAHVAMCASSSALGDPLLLDQIKLLLTNYPVDVIHFNVGLHGWYYSEEDYRKELPKLLEVLRKNAPNAKLIWATSTPMRPDPKNTGKNKRIERRNQAAAAVMAGQGVTVDDLFGLVQKMAKDAASQADSKKQPGPWRDDGIHYLPEARTLQGKQVAKSVLEVLGQSR